MSDTEDYRHVSFLWAAPEHAEELAKLHAELFEEAWDVASFQKLLAHPGSTAFMARVGSSPEIAGFILGQLAADEAEILSLGVGPSWQRHGIGRRLVEALGRAARKADARRLFLEVGSNNTAALALYRRLGFQETGRRPGYYVKADGSSEDALTLSWSLQ
jgi:ribosomal-protein-alanine N-acetyltransferase